MKNSAFKLKIFNFFSEKIGADKNTINQFCYNDRGRRLEGYFYGFGRAIFMALENLF